MDSKQATVEKHYRIMDAVDVFVLLIFLPFVSKDQHWTHNLLHFKHLFFQRHLAF